MRKVGRIIQLDRKRYRSRFRVFLYLRVLIRVGWEIQGLSGRTGLYWVRTKGAKEESRPKIKINWKMFKIKMLPNNKMLEIKHVWSITLHWEPENTCGPSHYTENQKTRVVHHIYYTENQKTVECRLCVSLFLRNVTKNYVISERNWAFARNSNFSFLYY